MAFRPRNPYYLRISKNVILPVYLYLDDRHVNWMNDMILQHVLEDLRPKILPKLQAEADHTSGPGGPPSAKKTTVETHRGETYQFCYFLRKTQPHSVVLKTRTFAAAPLQDRALMPPPPIPAKAMKRKTKVVTNSQTSRKKQKTKGKSRAIHDSESEEGTSEEDARDDDANSAKPVRRSRKYTLDVDGDSPMRDGDKEVDVDENDDDDEYIPTSRKKGKTRAKTIQFSIEIEDEEEKPKPLLHLQYRGFKILGSCLCIVVEPWPPVRAPTRVPSIPLSTPRAPSIAPQDFVEANEARTRSKTPLFLPDLDERDKSTTPFPDAIHVRPLPLYNDEDLDGNMDDADYGGMVELSQILNSVGDVRAGALDDDEDMEGEVFFGDADEVREL